MHAIAPTVVGAVLLVVFVLHQTFINKTGLCHHGMFVHRNFALSVTGNFVEGVRTTHSDWLSVFSDPSPPPLQIFYYVFNAYIGTQAAILYTSEPLKFGFFFACFFLPQLIACRYLQISPGDLV